MKILLLIFPLLAFSCSSKNQKLPVFEVKTSSFDGSGNYKGFKNQFVKLKTGEYHMGTTFIASYRDEKPSHTVNISKAFEVMRTEFTQKMWVETTGTNPSATSLKKYCQGYRLMGEVPLCPDHPVEMVSREDVEKLIAFLNSKSKNYTYDLPTEEQWEYYARGGTQTNYFWGITHTGSELYATATNDPKHSSKVKSFKPNNFQLHDTAGNVWEWTKTNYETHYYDRMEKNGEYGTSINSAEAVIRGGGWNSRVDHFRSSYRGSTSAKTKSSDLGFRLVRYRK